MPTVQISHTLDIETQLPKDVLEIARRQGEDEDKVCSYLQDFKDMIYAKGDCKPHRMDDEFLIKFLRSRFFKIENAYKLLCRYYAFRDANRELYKDVRPMSLRPIGEEDLVSVTPYRDQNGRRMMFFKVRNWRPSKIGLEDIFKAMLLVLEIGSLEPQAQILGGLGIFDLEGLSVNHVWHMSPSVAQKIINLMVTCMPIRTTAIHILNQSWAFDALFQIFKPFLNERMKEKIFIHGSDLSSLHKHIHASHLPEKYGGKLQEYPYTEWLDGLTQNKSVIRELELLGYCTDDIQNYKGK